MSNCSLHPGTELFKADYICIPQVKWEWSMNVLPSWDGVPTLLCLLQDKNMTTSCVRLGERLLSHSEWMYSQYNVEISVFNFCMLLEQGPINLCCNPGRIKICPKGMNKEIWKRSLQQRSSSNHTVRWRERTRFQITRLGQDMVAKWKQIAAGSRVLGTTMLHLYIRISMTGPLPSLFTLLQR